MSDVQPTGTDATPDHAAPTITTTEAPTVKIPRPYLVTIVGLLVIIAGTLVWIATPETCSHWRGRYIDSLSRSIYGGANERSVARAVAAERPNGCGR
jgi:hypothetical protein